MSDWGNEPVGDETGDDKADPDPDEPARSGAGPGLYYGSVDEFLRDYLRHTYQRSINGRSRVWDARWWEHAEAVIRLEALWRAWEHLRLDPTTGTSVWLRDHADHHMPILMDPDGPFADAPRHRPQQNPPRRTIALPVTTRRTVPRHPHGCGSARLNPVKVAHRGPERGRQDPNPITSRTVSGVPASTARGTHHNDNPHVHC